MFVKQFYKIVSNFIMQHSLEGINALYLCPIGRLFSPFPSPGFKVPA